jgi:hypothetical protein
MSSCLPAIVSNLLLTANAFTNRYRQESADIQCKDFKDK